jgi:preprotein translocase subunit YajC
VAVLISLVVLAVLVWLLLVRPQRRRQLAHAAMQDEVVVGDEIITAGGIHGEVVADEGEVIRVEIAPGVVVILDRRAIAAVARDEEPPEVDEEAEMYEAGPEPEESAEPR